MEERYVETSRGKIWTSVSHEEQKGTPLLVVHGGPGFLSLPQILEDIVVDRPVYHYDQLGCGKSDKARSADQYTLETYVTELEEVCSLLRLSEYVLMGYSWGCALSVAYLLDRQPIGAKAVILSGALLSSLLWVQDQRELLTDLPDVMVKTIEAAEEKCDYNEAYQDAVMAYYKKHVCILDPWPDYLLNALGEFNEDIYQSMWGASEFTVTGSLKDLDLTPRLSEINVPVLLLCGDRDEAGVNTVKVYQKAFAHADMAVIPHASHFHLIEQPVIGKSIISNFLVDK